MSTVAFTTTERVKVHIQAGGAPPPADEWEDYLDELVTAYSGVFETYLSRGSARESRTEYFDVEPGQRVFSLAGYPGVTISSVINDTQRAWTGSTISVTNYTADSDTGLLLIDPGHVLIPGWQVLRVVYSGGLATNVTTMVRDYPDLAHACELQVIHHRARKDTLGSSAQAIEGQSRTWTGALDLLPTVKATLDRYRRVTYG
jgi:hypothetical protein